jgi:hypothetical protein
VTLPAAAFIPIMVNGGIHARNIACDKIVMPETGMTDSKTEDAGEADGALTYAYRPSLLGGGYEFRLTQGGLDWSAGRRSGHVPFRNIRRLRLSYRPSSMQAHRFVTEIWAEGAPRLEIISTSWKSLVEQERFDGPYSDLVRELHRRLAQAGVAVTCLKGRNALVYWPGVAVFAGVCFGLAALAVRALEASAYVAAALIVGFMGLFLWQGGNFFRRNRPGTYPLEAPPPELLPG